MSVQALEEILRRAGSDPSYLELLSIDPPAALHGYDLEPSERQALLAGDVTKLDQLGVSAELSRRAAIYNREGERLR